MNINNNWNIAGRMANYLVIVIATCSIFGCGFSPSTSYWDGKVDELCKTDGGGHKYIEVELPRSEYSKYLSRSGELEIPGKTKRLDDGSQPLYFQDYKSRTIKDGSPSVDRESYQIIRRSDSAVIAEFVSYTRWGGEFSPPTIAERGIPRYRCPNNYHFEFFNGVIKEKKLD